jgi:hypothetical protein
LSGSIGVYFSEVLKYTDVQKYTTAGYILTTKTAGYILTQG